MNKWRGDSEKLVRVSTIGLVKEGPRANMSKWRGDSEIGLTKEGPWANMSKWRGDSKNLQCNLNYPDLVYPDPQLSGLAGDQKMHYYTCAEGVASDLLWVWSHIE